MPDQTRVAEPVARSSVTLGGPTAVRDGWVVGTASSTAPLRLADVSPLAKVLVRCEPASAAEPVLGTGFGRAVRDGGRLVVGSGPGEWTVLAPPGSARALVGELTDRLAAAAAAGAHVAVVDLTHGRALLRLTGPDAAAALAKLTSVDLRDRSLPDGTALRTMVARLAVDVVRDDVPDAAGTAGATRSYLLHCERSSGQYLADRLLDAGAEFGVEPDGFGWAAPATPDGSAAQG